jgi:hypothetical protein
MKNCPHCGMDLSVHDRECPSCKKKVKTSFTILNFLWDNFRLFTMVGITGTMISLIPNMGVRILGASWISDTESLLPLFLSIIIFFGTLFLTICFSMIFSLVIQGRDTEEVRKKITLRSRTLITWYEGDLQRFILLFCLVPMWFGIVMFFILLMPLIPNQYSWIFAAIVGLTCIPLVIYSLVGWKIGKIITGKIPVLQKFPRLSMVLFTILVIGFLVLLPSAFPRFFDNTDTFSGDVKIRADTRYFSPHISSAKGLRLEITNLSGRELLSSRQTWSADYGYFIRVTPSTSEVTLLGNPVYGENSRDIYWTFSGNNPDTDKKPVKIDVHLYPLQGEGEVTHASLTLDWYNDEIVFTNTTATSSQIMRLNG